MAGQLKLLSRRQWIAVAASLVLVSTATWGLIKYRDRFLPHRFYVVQRGAIYRGARQSPAMLRDLIQKYRIRTIVNLDDKVLDKANPNAPGADLYAEEKTIARELGLQYYGFAWKGSGIGVYEEYDAVADILATTSTWPVFIHCAAGQKRTNAGIASYWIRYRGHTFEQAIEGLKRYGLKQLEKPDFVAHLSGYCDYVSRHPRPHPPAVLRGGVGHEGEDVEKNPEKPD